MDKSSIAYRRALRSGRPVAEHDVVLGEFGPGTDWRAALQGVDTIVHLAARTHVMHESARDPLLEYRRTNVEATRCLAEAAAEQGVKRFVFLSSIKVNGERTPGEPFRESDPPRPEDHYGNTKLEAETLLRHIATVSPMAVTILRPPLVYGPGVKGNLLALMRALRKGVPLPLACVNNRRSLVFVDNLVSSILTCLDDERAANRLFLVCDGEDLSTPGLIRTLAQHMGRPARLVPVPSFALRSVGTLAGQKAKVSRLTDSLRVDASLIRDALDWVPPYSPDEGLGETVRWFLENQ